MEQKKDWVKDLIVYQVYPRSFQDSNGDGIGDIPGILSRLDHLSALGINALWLSPCSARRMTTTATTSPGTGRSWTSSAPWKIGTRCVQSATSAASRSLWTSS